MFQFRFGCLGCLPLSDFYRASPDQAQTIGSEKFMQHGFFISFNTKHGPEHDWCGVYGSGRFIKGRIEANGAPAFTLKNAIRIVSLAESAHQIDDDAYQQDQAQPSSANGGSAEVKTSPPENEKKNNYYQYKIHAHTIALRCDRPLWGITLPALQHPYPPASSTSAPNHHRRAAGFYPHIVR